MTIDLRVGADTLKLRVLDDGCGLSRGVRKAAEGGALLGVGVTGMRARMLRFGGSLRLLSDTRGTLVVATLPLGFKPVGHGVQATSGPQNVERERAGTIS